jgi:hypothetical protein
MRRWLLAVPFQVTSKPSARHTIVIFTGVSFNTDISAMLAMFLCENALFFKQGNIYGREGETCGTLGS